MNFSEHHAWFLSKLQGVLLCINFTGATIHSLDVYPQVYSKINDS